MPGMSVVRRHHNGNFVVIPNSLYDDSRLSIEAKGLLGYLLSRPHNWTFRLSQIATKLGIGRDKVERIFNELINAGYVSRGKQSRVGGKWGPADFVVYDTPPVAEGKSVGDKPDTKAPYPENPATVPAPCPEKPLPAKPHAVFQGTYLRMKETKTDSTKAADDAGARETSKSLITPEAFTLSADLMRLQHLQEDDPRCIGQAYDVQAWITKGWNPVVIRQTVEVVMSRRPQAPKTLRYFESAIAEAHAERLRPLPVASSDAINNQGFKHPNATHRKGGGGFALNAIEFARRAAREPDCPDQT
jgi:hypothetical protein